MRSGPWIDMVVLGAATVAVLYLAAEVFGSRARPQESDFPTEQGSHSVPAAGGSLAGTDSSRDVDPDEKPARLKRAGSAAVADH